MFPTFIPVCDLHKAFNLPYVYDYTTKLCRQQAEVIQNHENEHVQRQNLAQKYKRLKLGDSQAYDHSNDKVVIYLTKAKPLHKRQTHLLIRVNAT
jgi:hypothetical protein